MYLNANRFPGHILNDELLEASLSQKRITAIRNTIEDRGKQNGEVTIKYKVPWNDARILETDAVDVIFSHSVLEHIVDLEGTYRAAYAWLRPGGMMSHQVDFTSHGLSDTWNGYRAYSERYWRMVLGKRPFLINRQPYSVHKDLIQGSGFTLVCELKSHRADGIQRSALSDYWKNITDDDLTCSGAFIQARKQQ